MLCSRPSSLLLVIACTVTGAAEELAPLPVMVTLEEPAAPAVVAVPGPELVVEEGTPVAPVIAAPVIAAPGGNPPPAAPAVTPAGVPYTLEQALAEAALHATGPAVAKARLEKVRTLQQQAWSLLLPNVQLNAAYGPEWSAGAPYQGRADETLAGDASIEMRLFNGTAFPALDGAKSLYAAQEFLGRDIRRATAFGVSSAYLTVLTAERLIVVANRQLEVAKQLLNEAQARLKAGLAIGSDVTRAEVSVADGQLSVTRAERAKELGLLALSEAIGGEVTPEFLIDPVITAPEGEDPKQLIRKAELDRDDLAAGRKQLDANASEIERIRRNNWPVVSARTGVRDHYSNAPLVASATQQDPVWFVGLAATWTVYDGGLRSGQVEEQAAIGREQREQLRALNLTIQRQVRSALVEIRTALIAVSQAEALSRSAEADATDAFARYRAGTGTATELADAQFRAAKAAADLAERKIDVLSSRLLLRQSLGGWPLTNGEPALPPPQPQP